MPREDAAFFIHLYAEGISAALGKNLEALRLGMISPDALADHARARFAVDPGPDDRRGHGASVRSIEPAVRTPAQAVRDRMRIFEAETREMHHRVAIGNVASFLAAIEEQVRRIQDPYAA